MTTRRAPIVHAPAAPSTPNASPSPTPTPVPIGPADIIHVTYPPANATAPLPPAGFVAVSTGVYRGVAPRKAELLALPAAVTELGQFTDFATTFGKTAPPVTEVIQMFDAANQWSTVRNAAANWDAYCKSQEEIAWAGMRMQMAKMSPSMTLITQTDPSVAAKYPNLATLLGVRKAGARKAASTIKANKQATAAGKPATHGAAGKRAQRRAEKAALAAAQAAAVGAESHPVTSPSAPVTPVATVAPTNHS